MGGEYGTFELSITPRLLCGLRNCLLEGITDLVYADSTDLEGSARHALAYMTEVIHDPRSASGLESEAFSIRLASVDGEGFILEATRELLGMLAAAIYHVRSSLLEFEIPIRVKLEPDDLMSLSVILSAFQPG